MNASAKIKKIEQLICQDRGRGIQAAAGHLTAGNLEKAVRSVADASNASIAIISGFYIASGTSPAAENDGPIGAMHMAAAFAAVAIPCRIVTDTPCESAFRAGMDAFDLNGAVILDIASLPAEDAGESVELIRARWIEADVTHVISIERCGPSRDGSPRSAGGLDLKQWTAPLEGLFSAKDWTTIAIGDGGNELGMGVIPLGTVEESVSLGAKIACVIPCDHLILAGVSNWGGWAIPAALSLVMPWKTAALTASLTVEQDNFLLREVVENGPSIDGLRGTPSMSVDNIDQAEHNEILTELISLLGQDA
jgi:hypothetical protein